MYVYASIFQLVKVYINFSILVGTVLSYVFYWLGVIVVLIYTKFKEVYIFILHHSEQPLTLPLLLGPN